MTVVVFRRWSQERDFVHTHFARRFAQDPAAVLERAGMEERKLWPQRGGFAHASIVNGFNAARGEVIFTESWRPPATWRVTRECHEVSRARLVGRQRDHRAAFTRIASIFARRALRRHCFT